MRGACKKRASHQAALPKTRIVPILLGPERVAGFLAFPGQSTRCRAIIAIHEWWGLTQWVKDQATSLAANGYVVLALDLYRGKVAANRSEARELKRGLPEDRAIGDMKAAFDFLADHPHVCPEHIGALGWSMGGRLALQLAIHEPRLAACVVNYGSLPTIPADMQKINAPVLGIFGSLDREIPPHKVRAFERGMHAVKKTVDIEIYDGAGHAFENRTNAKGYRPEAAADAWARTLAFFDQVL